jgi:hypothetical protein
MFFLFFGVDSLMRYITWGLVQLQESRKEMSKALTDLYCNVDSVERRRWQRWRDNEIL